ncbi:MAG: ssDNA-binding domain-containing protein [Actinobacteria bacterium]|nr:ssDNA-binding domain-containing protein [Actinomycetota bacterium]
MRDKVEQLQTDIEAGVAALIGGDDWQRWLAVAARFPKYSFRNTLLILQQRPEATVVMGYRAWQALGHQVRRGETSIKILAPCVYKTKHGDDHLDDDRDEPAEKRRRVLRGFRIANVLALDQTDGDTVKPPWVRLPRA